MRSTLSVVVLILVAAVGCKRNESSVQASVAETEVKKNELKPQAAVAEQVTPQTAVAQSEPATKKKDELTREMAKQLIAKKVGYPQDVEVYRFEAMSGDMSADPYLIRVETKNGKMWVLRACTQDIREVTGIKMDSGGREAEVDFFEDHLDITPWGKTDPLKCYPPTDANIEAVGSRFKKRALFELYDDGWRMARLIPREGD